MPDISVLLPSIRPDALRICLGVIRETAGTCDYEVVVASPFPVRGPRVRWVEMAERRGAAAAQKVAYAHAGGDYVVALADYMLPRPHWLEALLRDLQAAGDDAAVLGPLWITAYRGQPAVGSIYGRHYPYFPAASRRTIERIGGWFDDAYAGQWCDGDLGMRAWDAGGYCDVVWDSILVSSHLRMQQRKQAEHRQTRRSDQDAALFLDRWHSRMGDGWPRDPQRINVDLPVRIIAGVSLATLRLPPPDTAG